MIRPDICTIYRMTSDIKQPLNRPTLERIAYGPYKCRVGRITATINQGQPQEIVQSNLRLYLDVNANVQEGDIAEVKNKIGVITKYIVQNVYRPGYRITECDLTLKKEV